MDQVGEILRNKSCLVALGVGFVGAAALLIWRRTKKKERVCGVDYPRDTVIVHQFNKGDFAPSLGHFVMKLETYLRVANIPFKPEYGSDYGPKHKIPWIEYNGVTMGDSQLIINYLNKEFNVDLNKPLSKEKRAIAWAIQKWVEEFTYHLNVYTRWCLVINDIPSVVPSIPRLVLGFIRRRVQKSQYAVGTARHTREEVHEMMTNDLRQLSVILGGNQYLMGTETPTEVDCAVFGILSQVRWHTPDSCPGKKLLINELTNLTEFLDRVKEKYWPDWNDRILSTSRKT